MSLFGDCPTWLDQSAWDAYCEWRKSLPKKQRLTDYARSLILMKLSRLHSEGYNATEVIQQSLVNCWLDVYPLKAKLLQAAANDSAARTQQYIADREMSADEIKAAAARAKAMLAEKGLLRRVS